ncbi:MAG: RtcB family protein [Bacteroidota bacterium]
MITGTALLDHGWTEGPALGEALKAARAMADTGLDDAGIFDALATVKAAPQAIEATSVLAPLAKALMLEAAKAAQKTAGPRPVEVRQTPLDAPVWGREIIDPQAIHQLENAMRLPVAVAGALMPDAHVGYGIPIGGVVALNNAVAPYMVGVDIACRMMMSIYPGHATQYLTNANRADKLRKVLREETRFGIGANFAKHNRRDHEVLDDPDWDATRLLKSLQGKAYAQLGTSGSGNHFVDVGFLRVDERGAAELGIDDGTHLAIMSHSGSRGVGAQIANRYSKLAQQTTTLPDKLRHLAYLDLDSEAGQEYWLSMNLAGRFASACHHTIHRSLAKRLKLKPAATVENHHNFAWKEAWQGREVVVHRKGATPAHDGVLGIIPGSQGHNSYLVRGLGSEAALHSASHGAGRTMSRTAAKRSIPKRDRDAWLRERGVELLDGGMDEAPQAYKDIGEVLALQTDLVEPIATFKPRLVLMARGGKAED